MASIALLSPLIDLTNGLACLACGLKLLQASRRDPANRTLKDFRTVYLLLLVAYAFFSIPRFFVPENVEVIGWAFWIANVFVFGATGFFGRITVTFLAPRAARAFLTTYLVFAAGAAGVGLLAFTRPIYDVATGATNWNVNPLFGTLSAVLLLVVLVPSAVYFGWQALRTKNRSVKIRSSLMSVGILLLIAAAGTFYTASSIRQSLVSDFLSLLAFAAVFLGVFPRHGVSPLEPSSQPSEARVH